MLSHVLVSSLVSFWRFFDRYLISRLFRQISFILSRLLIGFRLGLIFDRFVHLGIAVSILFGFFISIAFLICLRLLLILLCLVDSFRLFNPFFGSFSLVSKNSTLLLFNASLFSFSKLSLIRSHLGVLLIESASTLKCGG